MRYVEAEALRWRGDTVGAARTALAALDDLPPGSEPWLNSLRVAAFCSGLLGHLEVLTSLVSRLLDLTPTPAAARAWRLAANQAASNLIIASPTPLAYELLRRTEDVPKAMLEADPVEGMYHFQARSAAAFREGNYEKLLETTKECVAHAERAGDVRFAAFHITNVGFAYGQLGEFEKALETFDKGRAEAVRHGITAAVFTLDQNRGHILMCLGKLEEARAIEEDVIARCRDQAPRLYSIAQSCLARVLTRLGDPAGAVKSAQTAVDVAPTVVPKVYALACLAEALLAGGDPEAALTAAHAALEIVIKLGGGHVGDVLAGRIQVEALIALGRPDDARRVLEHPVALVRGRASAIRDPERRKSMLERVEDHRKVLELERMLAKPEALGA
jgi:tetratricopeptide (TPR) repeat protein